MNVLIEPNEYPSKSFKPGAAAVARARRNIINKLNFESNNEFHRDSEEFATQQMNADLSCSTGQEESSLIDQGESRKQTSNIKNDMEIPDSQVLFMLLSESRTDLSPELINGSIIKALNFIKEKRITTGFDENSFFVESSSLQQPHIVRYHKEGKIICDNSCPRFRHVGICSHSIAAAVFCNCTEVYAAYQYRLQEPITTTAGKNVDRNAVGKKKYTAQRKRKQTELSTPTTSVYNMKTQQTQSKDIPVVTTCAKTLNNPNLLQVLSTQSTQHPINFSQQSQRWNVLTQIPFISYNDCLFQGTLNSLVENQAVMTLLNLCHPKTSVCYGCGTSLRPIPPSPKDLVIVASIKRYYRGPDGDIRLTVNPQNAYMQFHDQNPFQCMYSRIDGFHPRGISLHAQALPYLNENHRAFILFFLGLDHLSQYLT